jgi:radical SAM protein with 4Fe4S-binding SPASM domain
MNDRYVPINKGNYSMDAPEREAAFQQKLGEAWPEGYADYRRNWSEYPTQHVVSEWPLLVDIELSSICNLTCPMCYTTTQKFRDSVDVKRMSFDLYKKIIDEIGGNVPAIRLSLRGEPTLNTRFVEAIEYAKAKGIKEVSALTHGGKLSGKYMRRVIEAGIDWITISVDGLDEVYDEVRKPLTFAGTLERIKEIKRYKEERGLNRPVIKVQGVWPAIEKDAQRYYDVLAPYVDLVAFNPLIDYLENDDEIEYIESFSCPQQYQRLVVCADGLVVKCSNDEHNQEVIGDIKKESIREVWHGEAMTRIREMHARPRGFMQSDVCRKCYLPRMTRDDLGQVEGRTFVVKNYTRRIQIIGR